LFKCARNKVFSKKNKWIQYMGLPIKLVIVRQQVLHPLHITNFGKILSILGSFTSGVGGGCNTMLKDGIAINLGKV
jgi:hypothetical protein